MAAGPPDDFIDTTAVEEEGSSYVGVDFERQELRVIFETMDKNNIFYKMLAEEQIVSFVWFPSKSDFSYAASTSVIDTRFCVPAWFIDVCVTAWFL